MKLIQKYPMLGSSADAEKMALTVKGLLVSLLPYIILLARTKGYDLTEDIVNPYINSVYDIIIYGTAVYGNLMTLAGLVRKVYYWAKDYIKNWKK